MLEHADRFEHGGESGFRHWQYCTAMRKLADRDDDHRAHRRDVARERPAGDDDAQAATYATVCTPSRVAIAREQLARLERAFDQLSEPQREVVLGARLLGLSHAELVARLGRTESAVRTLLCRSRGSARSWPPPRNRRRARAAPAGRLAVGEGFEPPSPFRVKRFSRPPQSATLPSHRACSAGRALPRAGPRHHARRVQAGATTSSTFLDTNTGVRICTASAMASLGRQST